MTIKKNNLLRTIATVLTFGAVGATGLPAQEQPATDSQDEEVEELFELEEFNVYAQSTESAIIRQRESNTIGSYLGSDSLSDLPDDNLGEALTRLPGVNVVGGSGDGETQITIRGADSQYNSVRINGATQANSRLASRNYDLSQIPVEMVASVEIMKSITPEYPADSIGGAVNITTASAFSLVKPISRYKVDVRYRDQAEQWGYGANFVHADMFDVGNGTKNLGMFLNFNYTNQDFIIWNTQNRFLNRTNRLYIRDPNFESFVNQTILSENPDADKIIWERFDPDERRLEQDEFTFNASFDYKLGDRTTLYFRPWVQVSNRKMDLQAVRLLRIERAFKGNYFFLDESGNPLGEWQDDDGDGILGSEGDTFVQAVDNNGDIIITDAYEVSHDGGSYRQIRHEDRESKTWTADIGGETVFDDGILDYRFLYSTDEEELHRKEWRFTERFTDALGGNLPLRLRMIDASTPLPEFIVFEVTEKRGHVPANNRVNVFGDVSRQNTKEMLWGLEDTKEDVLLAEINYAHSFNEKIRLKSGLRYRSAMRENVTNQLFFEPEAGGRKVLPAGEVAGIAGPTTMFNGKYADSHGPFLLAEPAFDFFLNDLDANPDKYVFAHADLRDSSDTADLEESISAAYIQGTYHWKDLIIVGGVRYEKTDLDVTWKPSNFIVGPDNIPGLTNSDKTNISALIEDMVADLGYLGDPGQFSFGEIVQDINATNDYDNFLPSVVATYRVGDTGHVFRVAWTNTLTRPDYRELVPFDMGLANKQLLEAGVIGISNREDEFDLGNPELTEQTSENWDAAWEYYFGPERTNYISVTLFRKELEDFLQEDQFQREVEVLIDYENPELGTEFETQQSRFWTNASERTIEGIEISGYFKFETILPRLTWLHGLNVIPNYTYITGDQTNPIYDRDELDKGNVVIIGTEETDRLTNQPEHIVNLQLFQEWKRLNIRLSYNYISELQRTPSTAAIDARTFDAAREEVDLSMQYLLFKKPRMRLFLQVKNIFDEPTDERYIGKDPDLFITSFATTGPRVVFGVRGRF